MIVVRSRQAGAPCLEDIGKGRPFQKRENSIGGEETETYVNEISYNWGKIKRKGS